MVPVPSFPSHAAWASVETDVAPPDVRGPPVPGLHGPVILSGGEVEHALGAGRVDDLPGIGGDPGAAGEASQEQGLERRKVVIYALDRHHGVPRFDAVAFIERVDSEGTPVVGALFEDGDGLVDAAQHCLALAADLQRHPRGVAVGAQHVAGADEILVAERPGPHLIDRDSEEGWIEALPSSGGHRRFR
ncbi:MAG: hypothetical protein NVS4B3_13310 [Gemmatimonadaceae bacterium]